MGYSEVIFRRIDTMYNGQRGKQRKQKAKHRQNTTQKAKHRQNTTHKSKDRTTQSLKANKRQRKAKNKLLPPKKYKTENKNK